MRDFTTDIVPFCRRHKSGRNPSARDIYFPAREKLHARKQLKEKKFNETRLCSPCIHSRPRSRDRVAPHRLNRRATMRWSFRDCISRYQRTRMWGARGAVLCASFSERPASRRAAQLTPLAARSWLNAPLSERVRAENPTWGADRRRHTRPRSVAKYRLLLSASTSSYPNGVRRMKKVHQNFKSTFAMKQAVWKQNLCFLYFRKFLTN